MTQQKQTIDELQKELAELTTEKAKAVLSDTEQSNQMAKSKASKYADPEILNLEKYPIEDEEINTWWNFPTEQRTKGILDVRRTMHYFATGNWIQ